MPPLNFHHLHYFWCVAKDGNLTRTAERLRVSQSALSSQIRQLEDHLGEPLFHRVGRGLTLSEAGRVAMEYAEDIFTAGHELVARLKAGRGPEHVLRVGAVATLSYNFKESFVGPLLTESSVRLRLQVGRLGDLLDAVTDHRLDVVLSDRPAARSLGDAWSSRRIGRQRVSLVGGPGAQRRRFGQELFETPMILPGPDSEIRCDFDALCEQRELKVTILAEVDDITTMLRLMRGTRAMALLPFAAVKDEPHASELREVCTVPGLFENFYAITMERRFHHPLLRAMLDRDAAEIMGSPKAGPESDA